jgi:hypothetical protein
MPPGRLACDPAEGRLPLPGSVAVPARLAGAEQASAERAGPLCAAA